MHEILVILSKYLTVSRNLAAPVSLWAVVTTSQRDVTDEMGDSTTTRRSDNKFYYSLQCADCNNIRGRIICAHNTVPNNTLSTYFQRTNRKNFDPFTISSTMISGIMKLRGKIVIQITNNYYLIVHESERLFWIEFLSLTVCGGITLNLLLFY